jgi:hypothetical protein
MRIYYGEKRTHLIEQGVRPAQARRINQRLRDHAPEFALGMMVISPTSIMALHRFNPVSYYSQMADKPISFFKFLKIISALGDNLLKAWLFQSGKNGISHELTISPDNLSLDGRFSKGKSLAARLALAGSAAPGPLQRGRYYIHGNAGILTFRPEAAPGLEPVQSTIGRSFPSNDVESGCLINGALNWGRAISVIDALVEADNFRALEMYQPLLSIVAQKLTIARDPNSGDLHYDLELVSNEEKLVKKFSNLLSS